MQYTFPQFRRGRRKAIKIFFTKNFKMLVLIGLGFLIAMQVWHVVSFHAPYKLNEKLSAWLSKVEMERDELKLKLQAAEKIAETDSADLIADLKFQAGLTALIGEGVMIKMNDSEKIASKDENANVYVIHDDDLLRVVNELRAAGAEAIAINGQRLTALSEIRCAGPTLSVNNTRSSVPFEIYAIGDKKTLQNAITMRGGVADTLGVWGIKVEVEMLDEVYIPPYKGEVPHVYARVTTQIKN